METLGRLVEFVRVCPEVECGLPTPREAMRLEGDPIGPRLVTSKTGVDHTGKMQGWIRGRLQDLEGLDLCGYICRKDSPGSAMERVKVCAETGIPAKIGSGMFTKAFTDRLPLIPVLVVPVTLILHHVRKYDVAYLKRQVFLNPHPVELMLRNHV